MPATTTRRHGGFSLIELVIVVVIIGIIGAIAIPRMSRGAAGAADSKLVADLAVLRNAIDLYATEHLGKFPSAADATFVAQMTQFSDQSGGTSATQTGNYIYGPYLRKVPDLALGTNKGESAIADATSATLGAAGLGWFYSGTTGEVTANLVNAEVDAAGKQYNAY